MHVCVGVRGSEMERERVPLNTQNLWWPGLLYVLLSPSVTHTLTHLSRLMVGCVGGIEQVVSTVIRQAMNCRNQKLTEVGVCVGVYVSAGGKRRRKLERGGERGAEEVTGRRKLTWPHTDMQFLS